MKKWLKNMKKDQRGLTLVELLAVVVILAIVAAIAFVLIGNVIDNSRKDAHVSNAKQLISSAKIYESTVGPIPSTGVTTTTLKEKDLIGLLTDPWDKKPYTNVGTVTKNDSGEYVVVFDDNEGNCKINSTEANLIEKGREACNE